MIETKLLGQVGCRFGFEGLVVYVDPYLSDSVADDFGEAFRRMKPAPFAPASVRDADWILVTHDHQDHCDPATLIPMLASSSGCRILAPRSVIGKLAELGVDERRMVAARIGIPIGLKDNVSVVAVPSAHPEVDLDQDGQSSCVGWLIDFDGCRIYHAGDTALTSSYLEGIERLGPIETVFLPVNETNFFRTRAGIVGNLSLREAFGLAEILGARRMVPMHWDLFEANSVFPEEIELVHRLGRHSFELEMDPKVIA